MIKGGYLKRHPKSKRKLTARPKGKNKLESKTEESEKEHKEKVQIEPEELVGKIIRWKNINLQILGKDED